RPGNIHYVEYWYFQDGSSVDRKKVKFAKGSGGKMVDPDQLTEMEAKQAVRLKVMLLKDNDCGVSKENHTKTRNLIDTMKHIDPLTYQRVLWLASVVASNPTEIRDYMKNEWLMFDGDIRSVAGNIKSLADKLHGMCSRGEITQDLDLEDHVNGVAPTRPCELIN
ncbi:MAG: hypothetical protein KDD25_02900, partial [Bdellovibrionales bacterium]|nr:hypothetical protein [Bdellovibrionales bacterium]